MRKILEHFCGFKSYLVFMFLKILRPFRCMARIFICRKTQQQNILILKSFEIIKEFVIDVCLQINYAIQTNVECPE